MVNHKAKKHIIICEGCGNLVTFEIYDYNCNFVVKCPSCENTYKCHTQNGMLFKNRWNDKNNLLSLVSYL